jgi:hypothetical protein
MTDMSGAAVFLRYKDVGTVQKKKFRARKDGTPEWPEPDLVFGRSPGWRYRTIIVHLAMSPGRGSPGIPRGPRKTKPGVRLVDR